MKKAIKIVSALLVYVLLTYLVLNGVYYSGIYPSGSDTMFHVYRGDFLYHSIQEGNWFPLLDPKWYNGAEILRYWAPFPAYIMAFCQMLAGGNLFDGYLVFVGLMCFFNAVPWLMIGVSRKRLGLGAFLGALWFFMPNNLYALFEEGNLARTICMVFLPLFIHYLYGYLQENKRSSMAKMMICFFFMALCHLGYAGMIFLAVVLYLLCYGVLHRKWKSILAIVLGITFSFLGTGLWMVASLKGGITSMDSSQIMATFFQELTVSLNPFYRIENGFDRFYFGLAAFVLAVFGILFGQKESVPGFVSSAFICICTGTVMYPVISKLPGSQYLWMLRFISIALCFILFSFLIWNTLKKPFKIIFCILLVLDVLPSLKLVYHELTGETAEKRLEILAEENFIIKAKEVTKQRMAYMDASEMEATGAYMTSSYPTDTAITFGAGWQGANTATNISQLNQALEDGYYLYLFDRCLELGNDTVLIIVDKLCNRSEDIEAVDKAAESVGYRCIAKNMYFRLYHMDTPESFGVVTEYQAIGIGTTAAHTALVYPALEIGTSNNLNDYSFEQLSQYRVVYLDGFTCSDYTAAEELITRLSESGIRIVISADGIPKNEYTGTQEFLGVACYRIQFSHGYPFLYAMDKRWDLDLFPSGYTDWSTVYLEGLDKRLAYMEDKGEQLEFIGTVKNDNIVFVGLNLFFHAALTNDASAISLLSDAMGELSADALPKRTLVPVEIDYIGNKIVIETEHNDVNTTIAYHDSVSSGQTVWEENNLTYVNAGVTEVVMHYPYFRTGLIVSLFGIVGGIVFLVRLKPKKAFVEEHSTEEGEMSV